MSFNLTEKNKSILINAEEGEETPKRNQSEFVKKRSRLKKSVMFFTWSEDKCFDSSTNRLKTSASRGLWGDPLLGNSSVTMTCSNCRQAVHSRVYFKPSWKSYVSTLGLSLIGCCYVAARYKLFHQGAHFCPLCQVYLGHTATELSCVHTNRRTRGVRPFWKVDDLQEQDHLTRPQPAEEAL